jgi:hypothetical protein
VYLFVVHRNVSIHWVSSHLAGYSLANHVHSCSSRISLISKSDIRYVGTLVEINSENSTVALENVMSYGTEDRVTGQGAFPASKSLYEYILFKGKDVKDLRVEEEAKPQESQPPNDPAILGVSKICFPPSFLNDERFPDVKLHINLKRITPC